MTNEMKAPLIKMLLSVLIFIVGIVGLDIINDHFAENIEQHRTRLSRDTK